MSKVNSAELIEAARAIEPSIVGIRRRLHQCPELLYDLHETSRIVCEELERLELPFESGIAETGIMATIGNDPSRCVLLRADMDALPIQEAAEIAFRSRNEGRMHACGHDCHTAMLLGAARMLKEREAELKGTVKLVFQPAEEGGAGGKRMCEAGVMDGPRVEKAFALHVWPMIPTGQLTGRPGPFLAATTSFDLKVIGKGGHAAMPHLTIDPIPTSAKIINEAQTLISRELDPLDSAVISFTALDGGNAYNVIPGEVQLKGTIRSLSVEGIERIRERLIEQATAIASANRCHIEFATVGEDYPATINDPALWDEVLAMGRRLVGDDRFQECAPMLGGEDFAYYGEFAPTCFVALGMRNEAEGCTYGLHHPQFKADEAALYLGSALHVAFALENLT